jgi:hypothetical protein
MQLAIDFDAAKTRGDLGAERAAGRAERVVPGWIDSAAEAVRDFVRHNLLGMTGEFTIEVARRWAADMGLQDPPDGRAWGHVTRRAVQLGIIEPTGGYAPAASSNGSPKRLYRRGPRA